MSTCFLLRCCSTFWQSEMKKTDGQNNVWINNKVEPKNKHNPTEDTDQTLQNRYLSFTVCYFERKMSINVIQIKSKSLVWFEGGYKIMPNYKKKPNYLIILISPYKVYIEINNLQNTPLLKNLRFLPFPFPLKAAWHVLYKNNRHNNNNNNNRIKITMNTPFLYWFPSFSAHVHVCLFVHSDRVDIHQAHRVNSAQIHATRSFIRFLFMQVNHKLRTTPVSATGCFLLRCRYRIKLQTLQFKGE